MDEFALIRRYFAQLTLDGEGVVLGIGDDAALLRPSSGCELVVTSDTLVAGRHFPDTTTPFDIGWKSLAVNLSDLAAMGARPRWCTLALTLPEADASWLDGFAAGFAALARVHRCALVGGDTTRGALSITITALGEVPAGRALRRDGARIGDAICVTGTLGDAALALRLGAAAVPELRARLDRPQPRIAAGLALRDIAHAALDLSDGLIGDLQHILDASGVGATLDVDALPMSPAFARLTTAGTRRADQLAGGDDYELCICLPEDTLDRARAALDVPLTRIGRIDAAPGLRLVDAQGHSITPSFTAYRHFS
ncbi:thiamine-phosphate kinase [Sinimarinibacterium thermocellulolyticum]|uniref:Thiamine-monophosphate kinase n=1 Tax=Sinimarinibacterium thermocellulolyticum TaxID=3170016 RepID=A0ABV2AA98_9GAMM